MNIIKAGLLNIFDNVRHSSKTTSNLTLNYSLTSTQHLLLSFSGDNDDLKLKLHCGWQTESPYINIFNNKCSKPT